MLTAIDDMVITFLILGGVIGLFIWNHLPVELVAIGAALSLYGTGVIDLPQMLAGFGDPAVILIASLFIVSEGLDATGITTWAGQQVLQRAGNSETRLLTMVMGLVALLTALISVNGAVASLLPMVVIVAIRTGKPPSRLLMPLAFAAHAGSMLALTGTPVNVVVSDAAKAAGAGSFGFFEFSLVGIPLVIGTLAVVLAFGRRLLPERTPKSLPADLSAHARTLGRQYLEDHRVFRLKITEGSRLVGLDARSWKTDSDAPVTLIGVLAAGEGRPSFPEVIAVGDVLLVRGEPDTVRHLANEVEVVYESGPLTGQGSDELFSRQVGLAELVIPPRSEMVGAIVFPGMITDSGDLVVLAVQRRGQDLGAEEITLAVGDTLLVQGQWDALDEQVEADPGVLVVDSPDLVRRQAVPMGPKSREALIILGVMVALLATGAVPAVIAGLLAASAIVLTGVLTVDRAYRGISWTTVVLVAAMIPMSTAMTVSGAAEEVANRLVSLVGDAGPYALLLGLFLLTATLGQLISNMATALIVIPIATSAALELGVSVRPVLMCVTVAAAASLMTPVATPANLMVMGPAGYRFSDYWKLGLPLMALYLVIAVGLVPLIWSF